MKTFRRIVFILVFATVIAGVTAVLAFNRAGGADGLTQGVVKRLIAQERNDLFDDGRMHVFTLGTGTPQLGTGRMPPANAVIAGDEFIIIDAGEGASRTIGGLHLPIQRVNTVLITHLHSDHMAGLGQVLNQSWNADRNHVVNVYGPAGIERIMDGLAMVYENDIRFRSVGHVEHNDPEFALGSAQTLNPGEGLVTVFERNGVKVSVFNVDHGHVKPAFGYRIDYKGKSVVFSGDTVATPLVAAAAKDADLLIHEVMNFRMMKNAAVALRELSVGVEADRAEATMAYHAGTLEVAALAEEANVRTLVLNHVIPGPPNTIAKWFFVDGMRDHFLGQIVVAEDGMEFTL